MLRAAAVGSPLNVPEVLSVDEHSLILPRIRSAPGSEAHWRRLGQGLAAIHAKAQHSFGLESDNYIGLNPQPNGCSDSWGDFFVTQRLQFQVGLIADARRRRHFQQRLRARAGRLRTFLDGEVGAPALLHGDLWPGNVLCGEDTRVWLIDPAVYRGDAEADLAMTELFGPFPAEFYSVYRHERPPSRNWATKKTIYNLYHLLNHFNIFGDAYLEGCELGFQTLSQI